MISESDHKLLTLACGEPWHHITDCCVAGVWKRWFECECGVKFYKEETAFTHAKNRTFTTGNDWELVLEKVVRPNLKGFYEDCVMKKWVPKIWCPSPCEWFLTLSIEERMGLVVEFITANPELFEEVVRRMEE